MHSTSKSQSYLLLAIILALIFVSASLSAADFKAQGYTTPAYVDFEFTELRVDESAGLVSILLVRSGDYRQTTTVDYQTSENEASEGRDYKGAGGTITFEAGESYKTITLDILADDQSESAESFTFELTGSSHNSVITRPATTVWIEEAPASASEPSLEIASAGNGAILLSWEATRPCGLERTTDPVSGVWEAVSCTPAIDGTRHAVTQPSGSVFYFYRLRAD